MAKKRTAIPEDISARVLFQQDHTCCICRAPGLAVQVHHIDENPSNHAESNLAVLCLQCHEQTQVRGGFGRKYRTREVTQYRDDWLARAAARRDTADVLAANKQAGISAKSHARSHGAWKRPSDQALDIYIESLPDLLKRALEATLPRLRSTVMERKYDATIGMFEVVRQMLINLAQWFPPNHFGGTAAAEYFGQFFAQRVQWQRALVEPYGTSGAPVVSVLIVGGLLYDGLHAAEDVVGVLWDHKSERKVRSWEVHWGKAAKTVLSSSAGARRAMRPVTTPRSESAKGRR